MKKYIITMLTVCMVMTCLPDIVFAAEEIGPGFVTAAPKEPEPVEIGPGIIEPVAEPVADLDFMTMEVENPIVQAVDKYTYDQMVSDIQALQNIYGSNMQVDTIGTSLDNRSIYEVVIGNPNAEKHILIQGGIHGREYMTPLLMMKQIEYALSYYQRGFFEDRTLAERFQQVAVHFVPMVNPDGIAISQFGLGGIGSEELQQGLVACYESDKARGKTSRSLETYFTYWKANARGVDLNLNFEAGWNAVKGQITGFSYAGFKGSSPLSEPESIALAELAGRRPWDATISYHSMGQVIYWDAGTSIQKERSRQLAQKIADATSYRILNTDGQGGFKDWMQSRAEAVPSITLEVGGVACPLPISEFATVWAQNKGVWVHAIDFVLNQ